LGWAGSVRAFLLSLGADKWNYTPAELSQRLNEKIAEAIYTGEPDPTIYLN
jgi:hypothetical protein